MHASIGPPARRWKPRQRQNRTPQRKQPRSPPRSSESCNAVARQPTRLSVEAEIARLGDLGLAELRTKWQDLYDRPAPRFFRRKLLVRALAYQTQVKAHGGLTEATKQRLREIAAAAREGTFD